MNWPGCERYTYRGAGSVGRCWVCAPEDGEALCAWCVVEADKVSARDAAHNAHDDADRAAADAQPYRELFGPRDVESLLVAEYGSAPAAIAAIEADLEAYGDFLECIPHLRAWDSPPRPPHPRRAVVLFRRPLALQRSHRTRAGGAAHPRAARQAVTEPSDKTLKGQVRLAVASRPGSVEARHVYGCSCVPVQDRARAWDPKDAMSWSDIIDLECAAHGRLIELQHRESESQAVGEAMRRLLKSAPGEPVSDAKKSDPWREALKSLPAPRTRAQRLRDAVVGFVDGWRGAR